MKVKVLGLVALAALIAAVSFSLVNTRTSVEEEGGSLTVEVRTPADVPIAGVSYTITGKNNQTGTLTGSGERAYATKINTLQAGADYVLQLRSTQPSGSDACQGSTQFDVVAGQDTSVSVKLSCPQSEAKRAPAGQAADVINRCPSADAITAVAASSGRAMLLTGVASDPDNGPSPLHYQWSSRGAQLADDTEAAASLACDVSGRYRVKLEVTDGACTDSLEQTVICPEALAAANKHAATGEHASAQDAKRDPGAASAATVKAANGQPSGVNIVQGSAQVENSVHAATDPNRTSSANRGTSSASSDGPTNTTTNTKIAAGEPKTSCAECEAVVHEGNRNCPDSNFRCDNLPGVTDVDLKSPLLAGVPKAQLCRKIIDCIHSSRCAAPDHTGTSTPSDCFCGQGVEPHTCFYERDYGAASGPCKELIAAGSETLDTSEIAMRMFDPTYAAGAAETVIETCDMFFCSVECL